MSDLLPLRRFVNLLTMVTIASPVPELMAVPRDPSGTYSVKEWTLHCLVPTPDLSPLSLVS